MEKIKILKNKSEVINCMVQIDGTEHDKTSIRLCLELDNGRNLYFHGKLEENGNCSIKIPKLNDIGSQGGKAIIEAIADGSYFKLYEADVELKNSVEVKMVDSRVFEKDSEPTVKLSNIEVREVQEKPTVKDIKPVVEEIKPENPFVPKATPPSAQAPVKNLRSFQEYKKSKGL